MFLDDLFCSPVGVVRNAGELAFRVTVGSLMDPCLVRCEADVGLRCPRRFGKLNLFSVCVRRPIGGQLSALLVRGSTYYGGALGCSSHLFKPKTFTVGSCDASGPIKVTNTATSAHS